MCFFYLLYIYSALSIGIDTFPIFYSWCNFLSEKLSQDALEKFFGCQCQKGRTNDNPKVHEFLCNTQSLRVIDSIKVDAITGNFRGTKKKSYDLEMVDLNKPLKKRRRHYSD